jgi:hypothetical protein
VGSAVYSHTQWPATAVGVFKSVAHGRKMYIVDGHTKKPNQMNTEI